MTRIVFQESKESKEYEAVDELGLTLKKGCKMMPHQKKTILWMRERIKSPVCGMRGGIVSLTMGLGKTFISLCYLMSTYSGKPSLVICPKSVIYTWKKDIDKFFGGGSNYPFLVLHSSELPNYTTLSYNQIKNKVIVITTYETLTSASERMKLFVHQQVKNQFGKVVGLQPAYKPTVDLSKRFGPELLLSIPWENIVCDESHRFCNPSTKVYRAIMSLYAENKFCLSGTPLINYISDLYSQFRFLGYKEIDKKKFNYDTYATLNLKQAILSLNYKECNIELVKVTHKTIHLDFETKEEKRIYAYYKERTKEVFDDWNAGIKLFSQVLEMFLRQRQICGSSYTILPESSRKKDKKEERPCGISNEVLQLLQDEDPNAYEWLKNKHGSSGLNSTKVNHTLDIISKIPKGEKVVVFSMFKKIIDLLAEKTKTQYPDRKYVILDGDVTGKAREDVLDKFESDKDADIMFASYKVSSEGLNLISANHVILFEGWWNNAVLNQAQARCHRLGQTKEVFVWRLFIKDTVEERMSKICQQKDGMVDQFIGKKKIKETRIDSSTLAYLIQ